MAGYAPAAPFHLTESEVIMNELITVNYDNEQPTVSARELHDFLEVGADFRHWFPRMCEYGFEEGKDFRTFLTESSGGRPWQDAETTVYATTFSKLSGFEWKENVNDK